MAAKTTQLKDFLDKKVAEYNRPSFIDKDPVCIPHAFSKRADIEIAGFFAAIFAWGSRTIIINKSRELMQLMDNAPHQFITTHIPTDLKRLLDFKHRTFNTTDLLYFIEFLRQHYATHASLQTAFTQGVPHSTPVEQRAEHYLNNFYHYFFSLEDAPSRTRKHIASPEKNATCKRLSMYLRWMVRNDKKGVDFGLWKDMSPAALICPMDLHVGRVARKFDLVQRKAIDWQTALELTETLRGFDAADPVKYDFALFGLGVLEKF